LGYPWGDLAKHRGNIGVNPRTTRVFVRNLLVI